MSASSLSRSTSKSKSAFFILFVFLNVPIHTCVYIRGSFSACILPTCTSHGPCCSSSPLACRLGTRPHVCLSLAFHSGGDMRTCIPLYSLCTGILSYLYIHIYTWVHLSDEYARVPHVCLQRFRGIRKRTGLACPCLKGNQTGTVESLSFA